MQCIQPKNKTKMPNHSCVDDPIRFGCEMLASCLTPLRLEKLLRLDSRRPSRCGGDDNASSERIDIGRDRWPSDVMGVDGRGDDDGDDGGPSEIKTEVRRLIRSAVVRGLSCPEEKSSLMSSSAYETLWRCLFRGLSLIDGSRRSRP